MKFVSFIKTLDIETSRIDPLIAQPLAKTLEMGGDKPRPYDGRSTQITVGEGFIPSHS